jgi:hypothetical protein
MSAAAGSECEPESTATAVKSKRLSDPSIPSFSKSKRSYNTVEATKRRELITMVNRDQMTIKEAANRLGINYSTAKHIVKSQRFEAPKEERAQDTGGSNQQPLGAFKRSPPLSTHNLESQVRAEHQSPSLDQNTTKLPGPLGQLLQMELKNKPSVLQSLSVGQLGCPSLLAPTQLSGPLSLGVPSTGGALDFSNSLRTSF